MTIYLTPKDCRELDNLIREKWAGMKSPSDESFVKDWRGDNCRIQFKLDPFRIEGSYGKVGTIIPPPGPELTKDEELAIKGMVTAGIDGHALILLGIIGRFTGKALSKPSTPHFAASGEQNSPGIPPEPETAPESTADAKETKKDTLALAYGGKGKGKKGK